MEYKVTRYAVQDGIATLTLHRPERLNSWTGRMHTEYRHALLQAELDRTRAVANARLAAARLDRAVGR